MKKTLLFLIIAALLIFGVVFLSSCTENSRVKKFGGTGTITLPKEQKLVTATWKGDNVWYLTKPMQPNDIAEIYEFKEESSYGIIEVHIE